LAIALGTPFISGKDSLNNEFSYVDSQGQRQTIAIPPSLLISAMGQVADVRKCVTMDLKQPGNLLFQVGTTHDELGGTHWTRLHRLTGGQVPRVDADVARRTFRAIHGAMQKGLVRSCHDLSEGGLAVAVAEMAFAGGYGARINVSQAPHTLAELAEPTRQVALLFAESNTRFVCEVAAGCQQAFAQHMADNKVACREIGCVLPADSLSIVTTGESGSARSLVEVPLAQLKRAWQAPLKWA
jgi:phosphoribosylformylglycinamidine synthase